MKNKVRCIIICGVLLVLFSSCGDKKHTRLPYYHTPDFSPVWADDRPVNKDTLHTIAPFEFTSQDNVQVGTKNLKEKVYAANFFFTSCGSICPKMTANLFAVADSFRDNPEVKLVSFSVMPEKDSVPRLKIYEKAHDINGQQWYLLTGNRADIYRLARQSFFAEEEPGFNKDSTEFLHTEHCVLVDRAGHIRGVYNATIKLEVQRLIEDIGLLLKND